MAPKDTPIITHRLKQWRRKPINTTATTPPVGDDPFYCAGLGLRLEQRNSTCQEGDTTCSVNAHIQSADVQEYRLLSDSLALEYFAIDRITGMIGLKPGKTLTSEAPSHFSLVSEIILRSQSRSCYQQVLITVKPTSSASLECGLPKFTFVVEESARHGRIGQVTTKNPDQGSSLQYKLKANAGDLPFGIDDRSGYISIDGRLDYEKQRLYQFEVEVTLNSSPVTCSVNVVVQDDDDEPPKLANEMFEFDTFEEIPAGSALGVISAFDEDTPSSHLSYTIVNSRNLSKIIVLEEGGVVKTKAQLTSSQLDGSNFYISERNSIVFDVRVSDHRHFDTARVVIRLNSLVIEHSGLETLMGNVHENSPVGSTVSISFPPKEAVRFKIQPGSADFSIDAATGILTTKVVFDREDRPSHRLAVVLVSEKNPCEQVAVYDVTINILDENDNSPRMSDSNYQLNLMEEFVGNTSLVITGSDADEGINSEFVIKITGSYSDHFNLLAVTGEATGMFRYRLTVARALDYDTLPEKSLSLNLTVEDRGAPRLALTSSLVINIVDINDNSPVFTGIPLVPRTVPEDTGLGTSIYSFSATDADSGYNGVVHYALDQFQEGGFTINEDTGVLYLREELDYEVKTEYTVEVWAVDDGKPKHTATATVTIKVTDVNDNSPKFTESVYSFKLNENENYSLNITAVDKDSGKNGKVVYSLTIPSKYFTIDTNSGTLLTKMTLDFEELPSPDMTLYVEARDDAQTHRQTATATLLIQCMDVNDEPPKFEKKIYSATIKAGNDPFVTVVRANDNDTLPDMLTYTVLSPTNFMVDEAGVIRGKGFIAASQGTQKIVVQVSDGVNKDTASVQVNITNSGKPGLRTENNYTREIREDLPPNSLLLTISIPNTNYNLTFEFFGAEQFYINSTGKTGRLWSTVQFDREHTQNYTGYVRISHSVDKGQFSNAKVFIIVQDVNDNAPSPSQALYHMNITERKASHTVIGQIEASDPDLGQNGTFDYRIVGDENNLFAINASGWLSTKAVFDREKNDLYTIQIQLQDHGIPQKTGSCQVSVKVLDVDDTLPKFRLPLYVIQLRENTEQNTSILQVQATDPDSGLSDIRYSIVNPIPEIRIQEDTGRLFTWSDIDREKVDGFNVTVKAVDPAGNSGTTRVRIDVQDENDNPPVFEKGIYRFLLFDNVTMGEILFSVSANDTDAEFNHVTYIREPNGGCFDVNRTTGDITLNRNICKDKSAEEFRIIALDNGEYPKSATATVLITVKHTSSAPLECGLPVFTFAVRESAGHGTKIGQVTTRNPDQGSSLQYKMKAHAGDLPFGIDDRSGYISIDGSLDYEEQRLYQLEVEVTLNSSPVTCPVNVVVQDEDDEPPKFANGMFEFETFEGISADSAIGVISAFDEDTPFSHLSYTIVNSHNLSKILILEEGGVVKTKAQLTSSKLDGFNFYISQKNSIVFHVRVSDQLHSDTARVVIRLNSLVIEHSGSQALMGNVNENSAVGSTVNISFHPKKEVRFKIEPASADFSIGAVTGELKTKVEFDREDRPSHRLAVVLVSEKNPCQQVAVYDVTINILDKNDNTPRISDSSYELNLMEEFVGNTSLVITGSDADEGINSEVVTKITGDYSGHFNLLAVMGEAAGMFKYRLEVTSALDYDTLSEKSLSLNLTVEDRGTPRLTSTSSLVINIVDINDNSPVFTGIPLVPRRVPEDTGLDTSVYSFSATDADSGYNGVVHYALGQFQEGGFTINKDTGVLYLQEKLDYEVKTEYTVEVWAVDDGKPKRTATATVTIKVTDVNDNSPEFTESVYSFKLNENENYSMNITAVDKDSGKNGVVVYSLTNTSKYFTIDSNSGTFQTKMTLDFEELLSPDMTLYVEARDDAQTHRQTATATLFIRCMDVNDVPPKFEKETYSATIKAGNDPFVTVVRANDNDTLPDMLTYTVLSPTNFMVDEAGVIRGKGFIAASQGTQKIVVQVSDGVNKDTASVQVNITDSGKKGPKTENSYTQEIREDLPPNSLLLTISIFNTSYKLTFEFFGAAQFHINFTGNTGRLWSTIEFDREHTQNYTGYVQISNSADKGQFSNAKVVIIVQDVNDNAPSPSQALYHMNITEGKASHTVLGQIEASDPDLGQNGTFGYRIVGDESNLFAINASGWLSTKAVLDREKNDLYTIQIQLPDHGIPQKTGSCQVSVKVLDVDDTPPKFRLPLYVIQLRENTEQNTSILQVQATDPDSRLSDIRYSILNPIQEIHIQEDTGRLFTWSDIDREKVDGFNVTVKAMDTAGNSGTTIVRIDVQDENDNPPVFEKGTYRFPIFDNVTVGQIVFSVSAKDADAEFNRVTYIRETSGGYFDVSPTTGNITLNRNISEDKSVEKFLIVALDNGEYPKSATATVIVDIRYNKYAPAFDSMYYEASVVEEQEGGDVVVISLEAIDKDEFSRVSYSIMPNPNQLTDHFRISTLGNITVSKKLDREALLPNQHFILKVIASDDGIPSKSNFTIVNVTLLDVNDNAPNFTQEVYNAQLPQTFKAGTQIPIPTAHDPDEGENATVEYSFIRNPANLTIDRNSGVISTTSDCYSCVKPKNYSLWAPGELIVLAKNPTGSEFGKLLVNIDLIYDDPNQHPPKFISRIGQVEVDMSKHAVGSEIQDVVILATDDDPGDVVTYSLKGDARTISIFSINKYSGKFKLMFHPDQHVVRYNLTVIATDSAPLPKTDSLPLQMVIKNGNSNTAVRSALIGVSVITLLIIGVLAGLLFWHWKRRLAATRELERVRKGAYMKPDNRSHGTSVEERRRLEKYKPAYMKVLTCSTGSEQT